jgi:pimeloyl-ACP methyl ester carboxylesterase
MLAGMLSREGFPVLRFDYYGTGDSSGDYPEANVDLWCANIAEAARELQDLADVRELSVVGLQLGATLATLAVANGLAVRNLMLWEPAATGSSHICDLRRLEKLKYEMLREGPRADPHELLGYAFPPEVSADLANVALAQITSCAADNIGIFAAEARPAHAELVERLRDRSGRAPQVHIVPEPAQSGLGAVLLATRVLQAMTTALAGSPV